MYIQDTDKKASKQLHKDTSSFIFWTSFYGLPADEFTIIGTAVLA